MFLTQVLRIAEWGLEPVIVEPGKTYIGKVRATSNERDTLALQLRLGSTLSATNLHPPGLSASAILCVRKFRDPLPGSLYLQRSGMRPPHAWEQAVQASLKQLVEHAARPARDAVPSHAEAVIFTDRAEMLACLASDWCEGTILTRWWWQSLFRGKDIRVAPTWLETPEYIPAALQHLASRGKAEAFVRALSDNDVRTILQSMIRSFALYELQVVYETVAKNPLQAQPMQGSMLQSPTSSPAASLHHQSQEQAGSETIQPTNTAVSGRQSQPVRSPEFRIAPWHYWILEVSGSELRFEQQSLLGIGLMLMRAPTVVRTPSFAHDVLQWWSAESLPTSSNTAHLENDPRIEDVPGQQYAQSSASIAKQPRELSVSPEWERDTRMELPYIAHDQGSATISPEGIQIPASESLLPLREAIEVPPLHLEAVELPLRSEADQSGLEMHDATSPLRVACGSCKEALGTLSGGQVTINRPLRFQPLTIDQAAPGAVELPEIEFETELGGLFYLINLGLFLNLYGDFTTPLQPGLSLSIWDFITLLGQQLLDDQMPGDPAWSFLVRMAGRSEQEAAGKDFEPPDNWRIPAEWLAPFPEEGPWQWTVSEGRLQVQHPAQFLVLDLPLDAGDPEQQLVREMQVYDNVFCDGARHGDSKGIPRLSGLYDVFTPSLPPTLARWLGWLMAYVLPRLQRALGLPGTDDLAHILCQHHAHISATATHLDIVFSLAELPIEIRLSGLDRNPGWVPAAGRFIAFQFE